MRCHRAWHFLRAALRSAGDATIGVVLAPSCAVCETLLARPTHGPVCPACWRSIRPLTAPLCYRCGDPLPTWRNSDAQADCRRCRRQRAIVAHARAIGAYEGALRAVVHALKYEGRRSLARPLARLMRRRGADVLDGADYLVPVPLHPSRRRQRGFNQAEDLARHIGLPVLGALRRTRATRPQLDLPAAQRHRNVRRAFALTGRGQHAAGRTVVLIDDVSTTGATLQACAHVLKEAGAAEVRALTAARVVSGRR